MYNKCIQIYNGDAQPLIILHMTILDRWFTEVDKKGGK